MHFRRMHFVNSSRIVWLCVQCTNIQFYWMKTSKSATSQLQHKQTILSTLRRTFDAFRMGGPPLNLCNQTLTNKTKIKIDRLFFPSLLFLLDVIVVACHIIYHNKLIHILHWPLVCKHPHIRQISCQCGKPVRMYDIRWQHSVCAPCSSYMHY